MEAHSCRARLSVAGTLYAMDSSSGMLRDLADAWRHPRERVLHPHELPVRRRAPERALALEKRA